MFKALVRFVEICDGCQGGALGREVGYDKRLPYLDESIVVVDFRYACNFGFHNVFQVDDIEIKVQQGRTSGEE